MEYIVTASEMKEYDNYTSRTLMVPEVVLMERASLGSAEYIAEYILTQGLENIYVLCLCGYGNNGADGLCVARILLEKGIGADAVLIGNHDKQTELNKLQNNILKAYNGSVFECTIEQTMAIIQKHNNKKIIIVDALFGIGLSRPLSDEYDCLFSEIVQSNACVVSLDVPSGLPVDGGLISGPAIKADVCITFGFLKLCHVLFPAAEYCGEVIRLDMGITQKSITDRPPSFGHLNALTDMNLPARKISANKGTYKKLLVIAGNREVYGAAYLCSKAATEMGIGMLMVMTHDKNRLTFQETLPEAQFCFYDDEFGLADYDRMFEKANNWADGILIGPGIGLDDTGAMLIKMALNCSSKPILIDADAIRLISQDELLFNSLKAQTDRKIIMTPHLGEFSALTHTNMPDIKDNLAFLPKKIADELGVTIICKDARSVIASCKNDISFINTSGNDGMASAGSGDALAGICAVLLLQMEDEFEAAYNAAYIHGLCGDYAAHKHGKRGMRASDLISEIKTVLDSI